MRRPFGPSTSGRATRQAVALGVKGSHNALRSLRRRRIGCRACADRICPMRIVRGGAGTLCRSFTTDDFARCRSNPNTATSFVQQAIEGRQPGLDFPLSSAQLLRDHESIGPRPSPSAKRSTRPFSSDWARQRRRSCSSRLAVSPVLPQSLEISLPLSGELKGWVHLPNSAERPRSGFARLP